ncbi:MAG TPA: hypothetical protein VI937_01110 [Negativicutes bacterium]|nr:hypothetical protein [Negativicutes bacterium]
MSAFFHYFFIKILIKYACHATTVMWTKKGFVQNKGFLGRTQMDLTTKMAVYRKIAADSTTLEEDFYRREAFDNAPDPDAAAREILGDNIPKGPPPPEPRIYRFPLPPA